VTAESAGHEWTMADKSLSNDGSLDDAEPDLTSTSDSQPLEKPLNADGRPILQRLLDAGFESVEEVLVKIGEDIHHIPRNDDLDFFWTQRAETPCMTCQCDFSDNRGPPIRTYSLDIPALLEGQDSLLDLAKLVIRINNRHLNCIKSTNIRYIPISHVWHLEVSDAHLSKETTREAIALTWFVPFCILNSARRMFKMHFTEVEIWHDYLGVPQWNYIVRQRLLLYLPSIFKAAPTTLIHLDDVDESVLVTSFDTNGHE
jgi:hypothetical protein